MKSRRQPAARPAPLRRMRLGVLLAALFLAAQLLQAWHLGTVPHRLCAEHGQLEHVDEAAPDAIARVAPRIAGVPYVLPRLPHSTQHHDHCFLSSHHRERLVPVLEPAAQAAAPSLLARAAPADSDLGHPSVALLRLAPKQSPPA